MKKIWVAGGLVACLLAACNGGGVKSIPANTPTTGANVQTNVGKELFIGNCAQCHAVNADRTGPALAGVFNRWGNDTTKLVAFVGNATKVIKEDGENSYAGKLYTKWFKSDMPAFGGLTAADIKLILQYVNAGEAGK